VFGEVNLLNWDRGGCQDRNLNYYYYYYYYYYRNDHHHYYLQFSCHPVAVVLTLIQTKQKIINIHKRNNTKNTLQTIQNTVNTNTHITKTPTRCKPHTYKHTPTHFKTSKINTVQGIYK
jgi:hypothetical protein